MSYSFIFFKKCGLLWVPILLRWQEIESGLLLRLFPSPRVIRSFREFKDPVRAL